MATIYLSSVDGSDGDDGSTWALAKATLAAALTAAGAGGTVYVDDAHAESAASAKTLASSGTAASPTLVICASRASGAPPTTAATTATVTTTGDNAINYTGFAYCYGVTFNCGSGAVTARQFFASDNLAFGWTFDSCSLKKLGTSGNVSAFLMGSAGMGTNRLLRLINTPLTFGSTGDGILLRMPFQWINTASAIGGSVPATLFTANSGAEGKLWAYGVDLSAAGSGKTLFDVSGTENNIYRLANCKLGSSVTISTGSVVGPRLGVVEVVNCDSGDTNYRYSKQLYEGTITHESTIVRTGGASDGTTPISRKMVSTANSKFYSPLVSDPIDIWLETTGAYTGTIEVVTDNVTLTNAEAWLEVEYLGTSGFPLGNLATDRATNILSTPANQTSSSVTWTTTGLTTPVKQSLDVSFTTSEKGWARFRVCLAKASTTMYFDPEVNGLGFTSGRQWQGGGAYINEGAASSGSSGSRIIGG